MSADTLEQYLRRHAEDETRQLQNFPLHRYDHCLTIPCFSESPAFAERLLRGPHRHKNLLTIVVVNQSDGQREPLNQALLQFFSRFETLWHNGHLSLCRQHQTTIHWLVVDRSKAPLLIPRKQGVGLARKIGCDIAVALAARQQLTSLWLHSSDADAHLPADYLALPTEPYAAAVYGFEHIRAAASPREWHATQLYEQALRYYVAGLRWAGSPYAQQPIGSLLAFRVKAYCEVRGFPKRSAGEDFYLLNKLAKVGAIYNPPGVVQLEARISARVPFGTGPKVKMIAELDDPSADFCYYAPSVFTFLKAWLDTTPTIWSALRASRSPLTGLPDVAQEALTAAGIDRLWPHLHKQTKTAAECERAIHIWFDAFQTLKFIRRLQARAYPPRPLQECLAEAPFQC